MKFFISIILCLFSFNLNASDYKLEKVISGLNKPWGMSFINDNELFLTQKSGEILKIEKLPNSKPDTKIEFKEILAYGNEKEIEIGSPTVQGAKVEANLIKNSKNRTILIFKKRRRQNSRRKNGHRQQYSMIRINKIFSKDGKVLSEAKEVSKVTKTVAKDTKENKK